MMDDLSNSAAPSRFSARGLSLVTGLLALYLGSRLFALLKLPIFIDEAIHIWWARDIQAGMVAAGFAEGRWFSIILMSLALKFPGDELWLARFTAVLAGSATLGALLLLGRELFSQKTAILSMLLYLVLPYALVYDRLALADSLATPFGAWILYLSVKSVRSRWGGNSVILACLLIVAMLVKISAIAYLLIPPITVLILLPRARWKVGFQRIMPAMLAGLVMLGAIYLVGIPTHQLTTKARPFSVAGLFQTIVDNSGTLTNWSWYLLGPPVAVWTGLMLLWSFLCRPGRPVYFLLVIMLTSLAPYILFAQTWYPRYLTFTLLPLVLLLASFTVWALDQIAGRSGSKRQVRVFSGLALALLLIGPLAIDLSLLMDPISTPLPEIMAWEFRSGWPSGYGTQEMAQFLEDEATQNSEALYILHPLFWSQVNKGGLQVHLAEESQLEFVEFGWALDSELAELTEQLATGRRVLLVLDTTHPESAALFDIIAPQLDLALIWHYPKPASMDGLEVWKVAAAIPAHIPVAG